MSSIPASAFASDDGAPDVGLLAALASGDVAAVQHALVDARVFVPLMALLGESEIGVDGLAHEKTSDIAVVTVQRPDGAKALPVFSSLAALSAWDGAARPLPVEGPRSALAAYAEGAIALLVDPGAGSLVLFGPMLVALAEGRRWVAPVDDPDVAAVVAQHVPAGVSWQLLRSVDADARLVVTFATGTSAADARDAAASLTTVLAEDPVMRARLSAGLEVAVEIAD